MASQEGPPAGLPVPQVNVNFVPAKAGETFAIGPVTIRIMEDGSHTGKSLPSLSYKSRCVTIVCCYIRQPSRRRRTHHPTPRSWPPAALARNAR